VTVELADSAVFSDIPKLDRASARTDSDLSAWLIPVDTRD